MKEAAAYIHIIDPKSVLQHQKVEYTSRLELLIVKLKKGKLNRVLKSAKFRYCKTQPLLPEAGPSIPKANCFSDFPVYSAESFELYTLWMNNSISICTTS